MAKRIRRILLDSSIYGAAIEDEATFPVESIQYWDVVYSKALFRIFRKLEIFGCGPIEDELSDASDHLRRKLNGLYSRARQLKLIKRVSELSSDYVSAGIFAPDALIAAFASGYKLDAFVTINRRHLKQPEAERKLAGVNRRFRLPALRILLPRELLELIS